MSLTFDPKTLAELAALLNETGLSEIELAEGDRKVRLARAITQVAMPAAAPVAGCPAAAHPPPPRHPPTFPSTPALVKSPMVGVAYLSAEPGAPALSPSARRSRPGRPCC